MAKVIFSIQYEISETKKNDYFSVIRELKSLLKAEGLENYSVYELKGKSNHFQEMYLFSSMEAYEAFDDNANERINILINKISEMTNDNTTKYSTLIEVED
jgi:L-rhamnose mutarotase